MKMPDINNKQMSVRLVSDYCPVLIRTTAVNNWFDQTDLASRQNADKELVDKYHFNWFCEDTFLLPSFFIEDGQARVGNGRHRIALLSRHLDEFPAAFEGYWNGVVGDFETQTDDDKNREAYLSIVISSISKNEYFNLPKLPIENLGLDINRLWDI